jgi:hypothetical protein
MSENGRFLFGDGHLVFLFAFLLAREVGVYFGYNTHNLFQKTAEFILNISKQALLLSII